MISNALLITSKISTLELRPQNQADVMSSRWTLKWRNNKLWVSQGEFEPSDLLPALNSRAWLGNCLSHSPVQAVCLAPKLNEVGIKYWADLCLESDKQAFLRIPAAKELPQKSNGINWWLKRAVDWLASAAILTTLMPLLLGLSLLIQITSVGPIFYRQWRVGERGKLFRIIKFRTMVVNAEQLHHQVMGDQQGLHKREDDPRITSIGRWMRKYSLDELPQLLNVLRGEMSLVGPRPWALYDALRISEKHQRRLNALPGMTGAWQVEARSNLLDLDAVNQRDLTYLNSWSIQQDFKLLLLTIPKVLSGLGAY